MDTFKEGQAALAELEAQMLDKGIVTPRAQMHVRSYEFFMVHIRGEYGAKSFGGQNYHVECADTLAEAIDKARAYIAALPSPEEAHLQDHLRMVADVIDHGHKHSLPDEYVAPLRAVKAAMTENLLTKEGV